MPAPNSGSLIGVISGARRNKTLRRPLDTVAGFMHPTQGCCRLRFAAIAKWTGAWNGSIPDEIYRQYLPVIDELSYP